MPVYEWRCKVCRDITETLVFQSSTVSCSCGSISLARKFSFKVHGGDLRFEPHFNHSVGRVVTSSQDFNSALQQAGDAAGSHYTRVDPGDMKKQMVDADGLAETEKVHRDSGQWRQSGIGAPSKTQVIA